MVNTNSGREATTPLTRDIGPIPMAQSSSRLPMKGPTPSLRRMAPARGADRMKRTSEVNVLGLAYGTNIAVNRPRPRNAMRLQTD